MPTTDPIYPSDQTPSRRADRQSESDYGLGVITDRRVVEQPEQASWSR